MTRSVLVAAALLPGLAPGSPPPGFVARPEAKAETDPSGVDGDSYDDPAIWLHPTDPAKSLVLGTNKKGGLHVFGMDGKQLEVVSPTARPGNVDVLYGFPPGGAAVDLAVAGAGRRTGPACGCGGSTRTGAS